MAIGAAAAHAQSPAPAIDSGVPRPGDDRLDRPQFLEPERRVPIAPSPTTPPERSPLSSGPLFVLRAVELEGNTVFSDEELLEVARPYLSREVGTEALQALRRALTLRYVSAGYINSGAVLPDQAVGDGRIRFVIVEGRLDRIAVTGDERLPADYVSSRLALDAGPPLNVRNLEERIQLLLDDPRIERLDAQLTPGVRSGESELAVQVEERAAVQATTRVSNSRPPSVGATAFRAQGLFRGILGIGEILSAYTEHTEGLSEQAVLFELPVSVGDTTLSAWYRRTGSEVVEAPFDLLNIESELDELIVGLSRPLYRRPGRDLTVGASLAVRRSRTFLGGQPFSFSPGISQGKSNVSALLLDQGWTHRGRDQVLALRSTMRFGLDVLDATTNAGSLPDGEFFAWIGQAQWARRLDERGWQLIVRADTQLTPDNLLPIEKFNVGGAFSVRGYRENQLVADNGYSLSLETRIPVYRGPLGALGVRQLTVELAPFIDSGQAWNRGGPRTRLTSMGAGVRVTTTEHFQSFLYYGMPLTDVPAPSTRELQDDGVHFSVQANFVW